jgi:archaellin
LSKTLIVFAALVIVALVTGVLAVVSFLQERRAKPL